MAYKVSGLGVEVAIMFRFLTEASLRKKYRGWVFAALLAFIAASAVLHFTAGAIIAALIPARAPVVDSAITIITLSRAEPQQRPTILTIETRSVAFRPTAQPLPQRRREITHLEHAALAAASAPAHKGSAPLRGGPARRTAGRATVADVAVRSGSTRSWEPSDSTSTGTAGEASGDDLTYPGRQIPSGSVWADSGPPGDSPTGGGIVLGGGSSSTPRFPEGHASCTPPRGDFF